MVSENTCKQQIMRLSVLPNYPKGEEGKIARKELGNALWRWAETDEHAQKIVDRLLETRREGPDGKATTFCPTPVEIREAAEQIPARAIPKPKADCQCKGTGFVYQPRTINGTVYDFSAPCSCRKAAP